MIKSFIIYFGSFLLSLIFSKAYVKAKHKFSKALTFILMVGIPVFVSSIRLGIGTDYNGYNEAYNSIKDSITFSTISDFYQEPLWTLMNLILPSYRWVIIISSIVYGLVITLAILRVKDKIGLTFPLFISYTVFYSLSYNGIRQAIACAIVLYGLTYLMEYKRFKYIICIILAMLIHKSAIFGIVFIPFFNKLKYNLKYEIVFFALIILSPLYVKYAVNLLIWLVNKLGVYTKYLGEGSSGYGFILYIAPICLIIFILMMIYKMRNKEIVGLFKIFIFQLPLQFMGIYMSYADRLAEYSLLTQVFLVPYIIRSIKDRTSRIIVTIFFIVWYIFYYIYMFIILKSNGVYPYSSIFS